MSDRTTPTLNRPQSLSRRVAKRLLPSGVKRAVYRAAHKTRRQRRAVKLAAMHARARFMRPGSVQHIAGFDVRINDGENFYILYKDIFLDEIYRFESDKPDPLVIDCGGNVGLSVLYYKHLYPGARVVSFEPDPTIYPLLAENVERNKLRDVRAVQAAIGGEEGTLRFASDGLYGSCLAEHLPDDRDGWDVYDVPCVRLRDQLNEPVDFLKINIEGAECAALLDAADRLQNVREMVVEYHHLPGLDRNLHDILTALDAQGFEYLVNDLDAQTNGGACPPFRLTPQSRYYLLIYARRREAIYRQAA